MMTGLTEPTQDTPRIALVTGATKGIGFEVARQLGTRGITVLVSARDLTRAQLAAERLRAEGVVARGVLLDVTDAASIAAAAVAITGDEGRLDILVNNAGIADPHDGPPETADLAAMRRVFDTNFFGAAAVAQAMLPLLRRAPAGRIVNISSGLGSLALNADAGWQFARYKLLGYGASKAALNMLTVQLAFTLRETPIKVNAVSPGFIATDINGHRGTGTVEEGARMPVWAATLPADGPTGGFFEDAGSIPW